MTPLNEKRRDGVCGDDHPHCKVTRQKEEIIWSIYRISGTQYPNLPPDVERRNLRSGLRNTLQALFRIMHELSL